MNQKKGQKFMILLIITFFWNGNQRTLIAKSIYSKNSLDVYNIHCSAQMVSLGTILSISKIIASVAISLFSVPYPLNGIIIFNKLL